MNCQTGADLKVSSLVFCLWPRTEPDTSEEGARTKRCGIICPPHWSLIIEWSSEEQGLIPSNMCIIINSDNSGYSSYLNNCSIPFWNLAKFSASMTSSGSEFHMLIVCCVKKDFLSSDLNFPPLITHTHAHGNSTQITAFHPLLYYLTIWSHQDTGTGHWLK